MATAITSLRDIAWIRSPSFDLALIFGVAGIALLSGLAVTLDPQLFPVLLLLDLWILGYQHVVSTYTRLCFDKQSFREHRFLIVWLPLIISLLAVGLALFVGSWTLATIYLYWQWWHYTRQSYGIARVYNRKINKGGLDNDRLTTVMIYLVPLWGIVYRSYQAPLTFLGMPLRVVPIPLFVMHAFQIAALAVLGLWMLRAWNSYQQNKANAGYLLYLLLHNVIFIVGYTGIEDINHGWLVINVWHNAQYILFVWMYNNNRFREGIDPEKKLLSLLSQSKNWPVYFCTCLLLSTGFYWALGQFQWLMPLTFPTSLVLYSIVNFHHYVVDSVIWKVRAKPVQKVLGIAPA